MRQVTVRFPRARHLIFSMVLPFVLAPLSSPASRGAGAQELPTIAERTQGLERNEGFLSYYFDPQRGEVLLEVGSLKEPFLYVTQVAAGPGWPVRRGNTGRGLGKVVQFERRGGQLLMVPENVLFRVSGTVNPGLDRIVRESLPASILWSFPILATEGGRFLVDATDFLFKDAEDLIAGLRPSAGAGFRLARDRSWVVPESSGSFRDNTAVEVLFTFVTNQMPPRLARQAPDPHSVTARLRHSFVRAPGPGYRPRRLDPRVGLAGAASWNFDLPSGNSAREHWLIRRWRLEKRDPTALLSEPVTPIVVYLEEGIPQEYGGAVREGVLYWNRAMEAAGFLNAIQVRDLPPDASPLDFRYPIVIVWSLMDFASVGLTITDPRTGEALKSIVSLGSSYPLLWYREFTAVRAALGEETPAFSEFRLQMTRWLAAHEFGHTLGMLHNVADLTIVERPLPWLRVAEEGSLVAEPELLFPNDPFPYDRWLMRFQFTTFFRRRKLSEQALMPSWRKD